MAYVVLAVAVLGLILGFLYFWFGRQRKDLAYDVISDTPLLARRGRGLSPALEVRYGGAAVQNPRLLIVAVSNVGNVPITVADYERPLSFNVGNDAKVLSASVVVTHPRTLEVTLRPIEDHSVNLEPVLLNPADYVRLQMVLDGEATVSPGGRIVGVREIKPYRPGSLAEGFFFLCGAAVSALWAVPVAVLDVSAVLPQRSSYRWRYCCLRVGSCSSVGGSGECTRGSRRPRNRSLSQRIPVATRNADLDRFPADVIRDVKAKLRCIALLQRIPVRVPHEHQRSALASFASDIQSLRTDRRSASRGATRAARRRERSAAPGTRSSAST